jgi:hypothetical protein
MWWILSTKVWLIIFLFYLPLKTFSLLWRRNHCRWRAATCLGRSMLGAHGLWAGRDLYRATSVVTRDLGFFGLIPFSRLFTTYKKIWKIYSNPRPHGSHRSCDEGPCISTCRYHLAIRYMLRYMITIHNKCKKKLYFSTHIFYMYIFFKYLGFF